MIYSHIQFLRSFAVVSVIIFHMKEILLPSGYLGVDIYFCNKWFCNY
jgi:peptidoglycan/LPS O-acetylase OafA/YrhL